MIGRDVESERQFEVKRGRRVKIDIAEPGKAIQEMWEEVRGGG